MSVSNPTKNQSPLTSTAHSGVDAGAGIDIGISAGEAMVERTLFGLRPLVICLMLLLTLFFAHQASQIRPDASFEKMIPTFHPYISNYLEHKDDLKGLGNVIRISVENTDGDIFTREFQETLKQVHDEVFYIPGIDRAALKSIWASAVRWSEVTEEGFSGGPVISDSYDGSARELEKLMVNILKSGQVGVLVANNFRSAIIYAPLLEINPDTGQAINYQDFSNKLEILIRDKFQRDNIQIHITGFAKVVGDLIEGASEVVLFFAAALLITFVMLYAYSHCLRSALVPLLCSVIAVVWQLGLLNLMGYGLAVVHHLTGL